MPLYLDDWLILAQSRDQLCEHRDMVLRHLSLLGLQVNLEKSKLHPVQRISFLGMELDSLNQTARLTEERVQSVLNCLNSFRGRTAAPLKLFQRLLGHMASAAAVTPLQRWFHGRVPRWAWQSGTHRVASTPYCRQTFSPWSDLFVSTGRSPPRTSVQACCGIHRCLCHGLGGQVLMGMQCRVCGRGLSCIGTSTASSC